jgi:quercetin dioxygenase-like cupin family protein
VLVVPASAQSVEEWRPGVRTLLRVSSSVGARDLCLLEQWHEPGCGAPTHVHRGVEEVIVVLAGTAEFWVEDERSLLETGSAVVVPPDVRHGFRNAGDGVLHVLAALADGAPPVEYEDEATGELAIGARADGPHRTPS